MCSSSLLGSWVVFLSREGEDGLSGEFVIIPLYQDGVWGFLYIPCDGMNENLKFVSCSSLFFVLHLHDFLIFVFWVLACWEGPKWVALWWDSASRSFDRFPEEQTWLNSQISVLAFLCSWTQFLGFGAALDSLVEMAWNLVWRVQRLLISYPQNFIAKGSTVGE